MDREVIAEKYGIESKELDQIIGWLNMIRYFNLTGFGLHPYRISKKDAVALDIIANAKAEYISEPEIEKISFKMNDGTTVTLKDPFIIHCIQAEISRLANDNCLGVNPSHRPPKAGKEPLKSILKDFIAFRNKPNPNQQYLDAGQFLADVGFLMNAEQWKENTDVYRTYIEYLTAQVKNVLFPR